MVVLQIPCLELGLSLSVHETQIPSWGQWNLTSEENKRTLSIERHRDKVPTETVVPREPVVLSVTIKDEEGNPVSGAEVTANLPPLAGIILLSGGGNGNCRTTLSTEGYEEGAYGGWLAQNFQGNTFHL